MIISTLKHNASIVIPSTVNISEACDNSVILSFVQKQLAVLFGGVTTFDFASGGYVANDGTLITEPVKVVTAFISDEDFGAFNAVKNIAELVCREMSQECVLFTFDNFGYLVNGD